MTYPTGTIEYKGIEYEAEVRDIHIYSDKKRVKVFVKTIEKIFDLAICGNWDNKVEYGWIDYQFIKLDYPCTPKELLQDLQCQWNHEEIQDLHEMRVAR